MADRCDDLVEVAIAAVRGSRSGGDEARAPLAEPLRRLLHADVASYNDVQPGAQTASVAVVEPTWAGARVPDGPVLSDLLCRHPLVQHYVAHQETCPRTVRDLMPQRAWLDTSAGCMLREILGVTEQLVLPMPGPQGSVRAWVVMRSSTPFSEAERGMARRVLPLLAAVDTQVDAPQGPARAGGPRMAETPRLTNREVAVLELLVEGLTAAAVARRLGISPRTVAKHLEHIYRRLGVTNRVSAVLAAQAAGYLPRAGPDDRLWS